MAKDPSSEPGEEAGEAAGPPRKESDPLFQSLGLKRRTTVIGLAPAPHLLARHAANAGASGASGDRQGVHTGPPQPLNEEIEEAALPPPAFGQTTMLMNPPTPQVPLTLPKKDPDTDPKLPAEDGWGDPAPKAGLESSPTILVEPPAKGGSSNVVRGFGGRVTPQGIQPAQVGPRPNRSDPPSKAATGSDPPPNTQRQPGQGGQPNQPPHQQVNANQPSTLHMKSASVSRQTQPLPPPNPNAQQGQQGQPQQVPQQQQRYSQPPPYQQQQPYPQQQPPPQQQHPQHHPHHVHPHQPPQQLHTYPGQPQVIPTIEAQPRRPTSSRPEPNEVIAEVVSRHPSYPLMRTPSSPDWPPGHPNALGERWKPRYPAIQGAEPPLGMATKQQVDGFRELRTRLQTIAAGTNRNPFTTLVVPLTSGSGGSFVARNLATAFAFGNERDAVLVDCNIEKPTQHQMLRARPNEPGLFEYLEQPQGRSIDSIVQPTSIPRLHLIPAGSARMRFQEHFSSAPMRALVDTIQNECFVFLDGPPAKGSPDARILSKLADFVILVVGYGKGTAEDVAQAAAMFDPAKFAGVVFNERD